MYVYICVYIKHVYVCVYIYIYISCITHRTSGVELEGIFLQKGVTGIVNGVKDYVYIYIHTYIYSDNHMLYNTMQYTIIMHNMYIYIYIYMYRSRSPR